MCLIGPGDADTTTVLGFLLELYSNRHHKMLINICNSHIHLSMKGIDRFCGRGLLFDAVLLSFARRAASTKTIDFFPRHIQLSFLIYLVPNRYFFILVFVVIVVLVVGCIVFEQSNHI
jgi:hypothetical protein